MVTVIEGNKEIAFPSSEKAIKHYKERVFLAWSYEDEVNFRRIVETLKSTDTDRISDSYEKEKYISFVMSGRKHEGEARLF